MVGFARGHQPKEGPRRLRGRAGRGFIAFVAELVAAHAALPSRRPDSGSAQATRRRGAPAPIADPGRRSQARIRMTTFRRYNSFPSGRTSFHPVPDRPGGRRCRA